jgi:type II secretory pathway component PulM
MASPKKKIDPISDKARSLEAEIAALQAEIKKLDTQLQRTPAAPKFRSTATPHGETISRVAEKSVPASEPVFEEIKSPVTHARPESETPDFYNDLGVRKYDLPALWQRLRTHFRGPTTSNPRLVNYLAAGGVHGLRPLRYEKRVARNRLIFLVGALFLVLLGIIVVFVHNH